MTILDAYWPKKAELLKCIKTDAEAASQTVLLAVHQPMPLTIRNARSTTETPATEQEFLDAFLAEDLPEGTLIQPVTGRSGAGKSHLIRWLAAQLERDPRAKKKMRIVQIPKSASLRVVVEKILEPLADDPAFAEARAEVHKVIAEVTPRDGAIRLAAGLKIALAHLSESIDAQLHANSRATNRKELSQKLYHANNLPHYFFDPAMEKHFTDNIFARIVSRAVSGQSNDDAPLPQFEPEDLMPPDGVSFGEASAKVRHYFQHGLNLNSGYARAAEVLNDKVLDQAIAEVFRLGQALGGKTLPDLMMEIRTLLFRQGLELVLLIEDFATLSGIQEALLSICIQEAYRDGKLVRAPMRTALAVTDGYLQDRDTILTRAKREWIVKTELADDDAVIEKTTSLVSGYLNAARWGEGDLAHHFDNRATEGQLTGWLPPFRDENLTDEAAQLLESFGRCDGIPLFPYNRDAIASLAVRHLTEGGKLKFEPRTILNFIVTGVLIRRHEHEGGAFPPADFEAAQANTDVATWLGTAVANPDTRSRLTSVIAHWGGAPSSPDEIAHIPAGLFKAFSLPQPASFGLSPATPRTKPARQATPPAKPVEAAKTSAPETTTGVPAADPETTRRLQRLAAFRLRVEDWSRDVPLTQDDARDLRKEMTTFLMKAIDWNALRVSKSAAPQVFFSIPNAAGEDSRTTKIVLTIADSHKDPDGRIRRAFIGIMAHFIFKGWNYEGHEEDSAVVANFIDELVPRYVAEAEKRIIAELAGTTKLLVMQSRIQGISGKTSAHAADIAKAALAPAQPSPDFQPSSIEEQRWVKLLQDIVTTRPGLQSLFLERVACFQGASRANPHAIDTTRLGEAMKASGQSLPKEADVNPTSAHVQDLNESNLPRRVKPLAQAFSNFADTVDRNFGSPFDKADFLRQARELVATAESANVWPEGLTKRAMSNVIEEFQNTPLKEALERIRRVPADQLDGASLDQLLAMVSKVDLKVISTTKAFMTSLEQFLSAVERKANYHEQRAQTADPAVKVAGINTCLDALERDIRILANA